MLIVTAENVTAATQIIAGKPILERADGTSDYEVWAGINHHLIWRGHISGHVRAKGAATLLRLIADRMDAEGEPLPSKVTVT